MGIVHGAPISMSKNILDLNSQLRKDRRTFAAPDKDSGHLAFLIPEEDFIAHAFGKILHIDQTTKKAYVQRPQYPDLVSNDPALQKKAVLRLLKDHPEYKINPNEGKRMPNHKIIVR